MERDSVQGSHVQIMSPIVSVAIAKSPRQGSFKRIEVCLAHGSKVQKHGVRAWLSAES